MLLLQKVIHHSNIPKSKKIVNMHISNEVLMFSHFGIRCRVLVFEWRDSKYIITEGKLCFSIIGKLAKRNTIRARPCVIGACDFLKHTVKPMENQHFLRSSRILKV